MRLIDADALKARLVELEWITDDPFAEVGDLEEIIDEIPTAERPHGEWKYNPDCVNDEMQAEFFCSICNRGAYSRLDNFCPNCGADMRPKEGE